jgi:hypothetical protein
MQAMTAPEDGMYERVTRRIARITALLGAAGRAGTFAIGGWTRPAVRSAVGVS